MMLVPCPWCGPRNVTEFKYSGEAGRARPDPADTTPAEWRSYLYDVRNRCGWVEERWYHRAGCRAWFILERHTLTNETRPTRVAEALEPVS